jgi:fluoride exporter
MDPDVDLSVPADRAETRPSPVPVVAAVSAGGVLGALARYGISAAWPHHAGGFPWSIWTINISGSFLIGVLMVLISARRPSQRLIRPFFGTGILGGYTTFSTSMVDVRQAAAAGAPWVAVLYLGATSIAALVAVWAGTALTSAVVRPR